MMVLYTIAVYCIAMGIISAYIAHKKKAGFFRIYIDALGGPLTLTLQLLKLKTREQGRAYYRKKHFQS